MIDRNYFQNGNSLSYENNTSVSKIATLVNFYFYHNLKGVPTMLIQYITDDQQYDNTEIHDRPVAQDVYTESFEYNLITIIKKKFRPYAVKSEDDIIALQSNKDNSIYTIDYKLPGYVTVQSVDNMIYRNVPIYRDNKLLSPSTVSTYVLAALNNKEIKYPMEETWFDWDLSWSLVKEVKLGLKEKSKHMAMDISK